ncbi:hypothetical protein MED121_03497 [Marinomonas sp. MED121]|uniref:hypothetical protein n=1 Tax=Marinomonas sp. MED121 TaxID=314277 RepID=UPI000068FD3F|nr:hypothetical protein [Marinomonas sp. MED121]EAQ63730.1 hypothetical protein MED121_03497 [Marinomonas sp. MED121]
MSFTVEQTTSLEFKNSDGETFELDGFTQTGEAKEVTPPIFKEDVTEYQATLIAEDTAENVKASATVTYTSGMEGSVVTNVEVTSLTGGAQLESTPEFECQDCDED